MDMVSGRWWPVPVRVDSHRNSTVMSHTVKRWTVFLSSHPKWAGQYRPYKFRCVDNSPTRQKHASVSMSHMQMILYSQYSSCQPVPDQLCESLTVCIKTFLPPTIRSRNSLLIRMSREFR